MHGVKSLVVLLLMCSAARADLRDGLVSYFGFSEFTASSAFDSHGGQIAALTGTGLLAVPSLVGRAALLTNASLERAAFDVPSWSISDKLGAVSFWVDPTTGAGSSQPTLFITNSANSSSSLAVIIGAGGQIIVSAGGSILISPNALGAVGYTHVAINWNVSAVEIYENGVLVASGGVGSWSDDQLVHAVGGTATANTQAGALIDEFALYDRVLTAAEIEALAVPQMHYGRFYESGVIEVDTVEHLLHVIAVAVCFVAGLQSLKYFIYVKDHKDIW